MQLSILNKNIIARVNYKLIFVITLLLLLNAKDKHPNHYLES